MPARPRMKAHPWGSTFILGNELCYFRLCKRAPGKTPCLRVREWKRTLRDRHSFWGIHCVIFPVLKEHRGKSRAFASQNGSAPRGAELDYRNVGGAAVVGAPHGSPPYPRRGGVLRVGCVCVCVFFCFSVLCCCHSQKRQWLRNGPPGHGFES